MTPPNITKGKPFNRTWLTQEKVEAGDGWELLPDGEPLRKGDGFLHPEYSHWIDYACRPDIFRRNGDYVHTWPWRRKTSSHS